MVRLTLLACIVNLFHSVAVHAQSRVQAASACQGPSITIASASDALQISDCTFYNGNITIASQFSGNLDLAGLETIFGDLRCEDADGLTSLTATSLTAIGGALVLNSLQSLRNISLPFLTAVDQIELINLDALTALDFESGLESCDRLQITNTDLHTVDGLNMSDAKSVTITDNPHLQQIRFKLLEEIDESAYIAANGTKINIAFPKLKTVGDLTLNNAVSIDISLLAHVSGSLSFDSGSYELLSAPQLVSIDSALSVTNSDTVDSLSFPRLQSSGGSISIKNNPKLITLGNMERLTRIGGDLELAGSFESIFNINNMTEIHGDVIVTTSSKLPAVCDILKTTKEKTMIIGGTVQCTKTSTLSKGRIAGIAVVAVLIPLIVAGFTLWFCFIHPQRRWRKRQTRPTQYGEIKHLGNDEIPQGYYHSRAELFAPMKHVIELTGEAQHRKYASISTTVVTTASASDSESETTLHSQGRKRESAMRKFRWNRMHPPSIGPGFLAWDRKVAELDGRVRDSTARKSTRQSGIRITVTAPSGEIQSPPLSSRSKSVSSLAVQPLRGPWQKE